MKVNFLKYPSIKELGGEVYYLGNTPINESEIWSLFNPSIGVDSSNNYAIVFKSSNFRFDFPLYKLVYSDVSNLYDTSHSQVVFRNYFAELDDDLKSIKSFKEINFVDFPFSIKRGIEDIRLFWRDSSWWFLGVAHERPHMNVVKVCLFKYDKDKNEAKFIEMYDSPTGTKVEKNWALPYEKNENFDFIYSCGTTLKDGKIKVNQNIKNLKFSGGSCLIDLKDKTYLSVVHGYHVRKHYYYSSSTFSYNNESVRDYYHAFVRYNWNGEIIQYTDPFRFISPGVEFAIGLVEKDKNLIISFGKQDSESYISIISKDKILNMLKDI